MADPSQQRFPVPRAGLAGLVGVLLGLLACGVAAQSPATGQTAQEQREQLRAALKQGVPAPTREIAAVPARPGSAAPGARQLSGPERARLRQQLRAAPGNVAERPNAPGMPTAAASANRSSP